VDGIINSIGPHKCRTPRIKATPPWYAYVKIAEGCSNYCSYCLIPSIRGKVRFRKIDDILEEVKILAGKGVKEIIYVAQDTTAFPNFALLLKKTAKIRGIHWIRIMYAHPSHLSEHLLETISREKKIVKYLDLPIQHVCDSILERMNRRYKRLDLKNLIKKIREKGVALRTSVIVGFPGESEVDFKELLHFIEEVRFERLGVFSFEKEEGTPANKMRGQVSEKRKTERFEKLMRAQARISREMNEKLVGKTFETLIEGMKGGYYFGRTALDAPEIDGQVFIKSENTLRPGEFVKVKISKAKTYDLIGSLT
jgi:ribosomal protein S12 methylthiotransferase